VTVPPSHILSAQVYHSKAKNSYSNAENDLKVIQTRSGHILEFNDKQGAETITLKDKNNNIITIDTPKGCIIIQDKKKNKIIINAPDDSITITANASLTMNAPDITMNADNITMNATTVVTNATTINSLAKGAITMNAGGAIEGAAVGMVTLEQAFQLH
jgi:phage baseplate assembly protein gpV